MKPQDVVALFSLLIIRKPDWIIAEIANRACLSVAETHAACKRLETCGLLSPLTRRPVLPSVEEFLFHGFKYVFPAEVGRGGTRGMPTAHSAHPLCEQIVGGGNDPYVWPCPYGTIRGIAVTPLYKTVPEAVQKDADLYEFLALSDAMCIGRARECTLAEQQLRRKLSEFREGAP